jgi:hypothetical protein
MSDDDARERSAILARRNRFVTATLAGLAGVAGTALATACPCLKMAPSQPDPSSNDAPADANAGEAPENVEAATDTEAPAEDAKADAPQR